MGSPVGQTGLSPQYQSLKHTYQLRVHVHNHITQAVAATESGFAIVGAHQHGVAVGSHFRPFTDEASAKHFFKRQLHRKQVVSVGWEPQNGSPTACVWRWDEKIDQKVFDARVFPPPIDPRALPCWWAPIRAKQLSMAATAGVIWLCACVRYRPYRRVGTCAWVHNLVVILSLGVNFAM